jgi:hypothetical protein
MTPKLGKAKLWYFCTAFLPNEIYLPTKFHVDISNSIRVMPGQKSNCKNERREITKKLGNADIRFFCTALLLNEKLLPTNFLVDPFYVLCHGHCSK